MIPPGSVLTQDPQVTTAADASPDTWLDTHPRCIWCGDEISQFDPFPPYCSWCDWMRLYRYCVRCRDLLDDDEGAYCEWCAA